MLKNDTTVVFVIVVAADNLIIIGSVSVFRRVPAYCLYIRQGGVLWGGARDVAIAVPCLRRVSRAAVVVILQRVNGGVRVGDAG